MKRFIQNIQNIWKVEELRKRIIYTLALILVYRIGSFIILPGVNYNALEAAQKAGGQNALETLLSLFSGGGFTNASIMALGIMPYISASIIMQLLGRKKANQQLHAYFDNHYLCCSGTGLFVFVCVK
jgi:preprotein translocase subunit SecY